MRYITWVKIALCIQPAVSCIYCFVRYITSVLGKERVFPTGCTALSGISDINQGNFVYSNVTVDIHEMFIAALEKNIKYLGKLLKINT